MYREGDWIIENVHGLLGQVIRVFPDGVTAHFGGMTAVRSNDNIEIAPLDIREEDILAMQHLAVETNDVEWFKELSKRMEVGVHG